MSPRLDLPLAVLAWCAGFLWLGHSGSWLLLALLATVCAARLAWGDPQTRRLLTPTPLATGFGLLGAMVMIAGTYALYPPIGQLFPALAPTTAHLYRLLRTGAPSTMSMVVLVVLVSAAEEIMWRGRPLASEDTIAPPRWPVRTQLLRVLGVSAVYGAAHAASGTVTLVVLAFVCGVAWGLLRVATHSLWAPILTHVLWDLAIMVWWPLA